MRSASPASSTSAAPASPAATSTAARSPPSASSPIRSAREPGARMYRTGDLARYRTRRPHRVPRPQRPPGQDPRLPHRAGRDRGPARARYPGIAEAVVVAREDGPGDRRLVAYYAARAQPAAVLALDALRAHLAAALPDYMVPAAYVELAALPAHPQRQARSQGAARARRRRRSSCAATSRPSAPSRPRSRGCGPSCSASSASAATITSSSSAATRCSP